MSAHRSRTAWALLSPGLSTTTRKIAAPVSGAITACGSGAVLLASVLTRPSSTSPCGAASIGTNLAARPARAGAGGATRLAGVPTWRRHQRDHGDWPLGGPISMITKSGRWLVGILLLVGFLGLYSVLALWVAVGLCGCWGLGRCSRRWNAGRPARLPRGRSP